MNVSPTRDGWFVTKLVHPGVSITSVALLWGEEIGEGEGRTEREGEREGRRERVGERE